MRILVTGGAGFIGSHFSEHLLASGHELVVLDRFDELLYAASIKEQNLESLMGQPGFSLVRGDILDADLVESLFAGHGFSALVHLAALAGVRPSISRPAEYMRVNVEGTAVLLEAARRHGVEKVVVASSSSVYGTVTEPPSREEDLAAADAPVSPYAASKRATELLCQTWHQLYGLPITCLRFFTVYGPRQRPEMAIHRFVRQMSRGETLELYGDGSSGRDYTYVDDIVLGMERALERAEGFNIYNLGNNQTVGLLALVEKIAAQLEVRPKLAYRPMQPGDVPLTCASLEQVREALDWTPAVPIDAGLRRFVEWFRRQP